MKWGQRGSKKARGVCVIHSRYMGEEISLGDLGRYKSHDITTAAAPTPEDALMAKEEAEVRSRMLDRLDNLSPVATILMRARFGIVTPQTYRADELYNIVKEGYIVSDEDKQRFIERCNDPKNEVLYSLVHGTGKTQLAPLAAISTMNGHNGQSNLCAHFCRYKHC